MMVIPITRLSRRTLVAYGAILLVTLLSLAIVIFFHHKSLRLFKKPLNVILIVIDALRSDHLGCYGYYRDTTPNIDRFSKDCAVFENVIAQSSWTMPSFASLFTANYPAVHQCTTEQNGLGSSNVTLAEVLRENNYLTCGFVEAGYLTKKFGFDQGFNSLSRISKKNSKESLKIWLEWVKENRENKFFLFIHTLEVHQPYTPVAPYNMLYDPGYTGKFSGGVIRLRSKDLNKSGYSEDPELSSDDLKHIIALYDGEINYIDAVLGNFIEGLKRLNLYDNSLIIITADHGDAFYEHKILEHWKLLYDEVLKIPLIIKFPHSQFKGRRIGYQVRSIDIMPTILEAVGLTAEENVQGESLIKLLKSGKGSDRADRIAFSDVTSGEDWGKQIITVNTGKYKYIYLSNSQDPASGLLKEELYDIKADPGETCDLIQNEPAIRDSMKSMVKEYIESGKKHSYPSGHSTIDSETAEELRSLGYLH